MLLDKTFFYFYIIVITIKLNSKPVKAVLYVGYTDNIEIGEGEMPTVAHKDKRLHLSQVLLIYIAPTLDAKVIPCHSAGLDYNLIY